MQFYLNDQQFEVLTDTGFRPFAGVAKMGNKQVIRVSIKDMKAKVTSEHQFFDVNMNCIFARDVRIGTVLATHQGFLPVESIEHLESEDVYDLIEVGDNHRYYTNGILSHNCEFLSSEALLIDSAFLLTLHGQEPIKEQREFLFWEPIYNENTYIVTVDPSTGSGEDSSVIDVYHFPSLVQVAQLRSNTLSTPQLYSRLKWVLKGLENKLCEVYFTVENNGIGEGIIALYEADEHPPLSAIFVGDDSKREGMSTQGRSKLKACIAYKELVESRQVTINSKQTVSELKTFVRSAGSYQAQRGATDDCVSTGLLLARLLQEISAYEEDAFDKMYRVSDDGEVYHISEIEAREAADF